MNKTITLEFPTKKLEALSHFLKKKDTTINTELDYAVRKDRAAHCPGIPGGHGGGRRCVPDYLKLLGRM